MLFLCAMFEFIKNFFKKEVIEKEDVSIKALEKWFDSKVNVLREDFSPVVDNTKSEIEERIKKVKEALKELETAKLKNPDIPGRALNFMEGNRKTYVKRVNDFLDKIKLDKIKSTEEFVKEFNQNIVTFGKLSARPYQIMQEFFGEESGIIAVGIRDINNSVSQMKESMEKLKMNIIEYAREQIKSLMRDIDLRKAISSGLEQLKQDFEELKGEKKKFEEKIKELKSSEENKSLTDFLENKKGIEEHIEEKKQKIRHSFHVIEAGMKKLERIVYENSDLVKKYIEKPVKTLLADNELGIINLLSKMKENLASGAIELKESKKQRILSEIENMGKDLFNDFLENHKNMKEKLSQINEKILENEIGDEISDFEKKLLDIDNKITDLSSKISESKEKIEKINIVQVKDNLSKQIKKVLDLEITIS